MSYVCSLQGKESTSLSDIGGKALNLHEISKIDGINVPEGFCITTKAYKELFSSNQDIDSLINELSKLKPTDLKKISNISLEIRNLIETIKIPDDLMTEISINHARLSDKATYAVRSSATAEDLPTASFAGQQDTYLNILGLESIIEHIIKCWASLFTDRAVIYRMQNDFDHKHVYLAVIVQKMISSKASGIMFTADPLSSNRKIISIDASFGLGEALVSGKVTSDNYRVMENTIVDKNISTKKTEIIPDEDGGTLEKIIDSSMQNSQTLTDNQILELEKIGRKIEKHFLYPQDIEWCLVDDSFSIVQSRPITTLYPLPKVTEGEIGIFMSSGHMQMMTDPMKPLGLFFYHSVFGSPPGQYIGGRLYVDITHDLTTPFGRLIAKSIIKMIGDELITSSITKIINNKKLIKSLPKGKEKVFNLEKNSGPFAIMFNAYKAYKANDPDIVKILIAAEDKSIDQMENELKKLSGDAVFEYILNDHDNRRQKIATPPIAGAITAGLLPTNWFNKKIKKWIGVENASDTFVMSIPNSVTADAGFGLIDVADSIRDYPDIIEYLNDPKDETFFEDISRLDGGEKACNAIKEYLSKFGMRCSGDVDITVPRWSEKPTEIVSIILSNIKNFEVNGSKLKYDQGIVESERRIEELASQVEKLPGGKKKAKKVRKVASVIRNYIGIREYPKFSFIKRYFIYKQAMLKEAATLVKKGTLSELEDIYYLYFDELRTAIKDNKLDYGIINKRKKDFENFKKLTPPRIMTSDGEVIIGQYDTNNLPANSLPGLPVSAGVVEGRARIIKSLKDVTLSEGDILVAEFTDPSWTPAFVSIKALVTEVGGLITHGSIIAREYGLPAVVSVENATKLIKDGDMIRVNGTEGYVEILN